jgi:L-ribulokinase
VDVRLSGLLLGQSLHTTPPEIYRALIEGTAFGALAIIDRIEQYGVRIDEVVNCGGLAEKNNLLMQIYADVAGRPMKLSRSSQTPALGAAIFAAVAAGEAAGGYKNVAEAQKRMTGISAIFNPDQNNEPVYRELYQLYKQLHDAFGTADWSGKMFNVMKDLLEIRDRMRSKK